MKKQRSNVVRQLKNVGLSLSVAVSTAVAAPPAATWPTLESAWQTLAPHPRLLAAKGQFDRLRSADTSDPVLADVRTLVLRMADRAVEAPAIKYVDGPAFMMGVMRAGQGRIVTCTMAYRLTADKKYFDAARRELLALAALPDWCPRHFLDVGEAAFACGIGLDWLYDDLAEADRATIATAIVTNALRPSLAVPDEANSWVKGDFNWNPVCHCGLCVGALAVAERQPELARKIVARALACVPHAGASYAPDGAFPEGPSYWSYGTTFYVLLVEALRSSLHDDFGLVTPGVLRSIDYLAQVKAPSGEDFNYADYHERRPPEPVAFWFARELRRRDVVDTDIGVVHAIVSSKKVNDYDDSTAQRMLPMELLWWDPTLTAAAAPLTRHYVAGGAAPLAIFRSAWKDPTATFVAMKGGTPNGSHAHMDCGGFVLEGDGVRWAVDLGTENYNRIRAAKVPGMFDYAQDSGRWTVFRDGPEAHNILRFNGRPQMISGFAPVKPLPDAPDGTASAEFDLSGLYAGQATNVRRVLSLHPDRSVTIADTWTAGESPSDVAWQWMTRAAVTVEGDRVTLRESGKTLTLAISAATPVDVRVEDVSQPRAPQDSPNPGCSRISVHVSTPARSTAGLTVHAIPGSVNGR